MKKRLFAIMLLFLVLALVVTPVYAQDYSFQVTKADVNLYVNKDGTVSIEYTYEFTNNPGAHVIDFVDIGMPNTNYDINNIVADVNGKKITDIQRSNFAKNGFAVGLGADSIAPGQSGKVHVWVPTVQGMINPSGQGGEKNYASIQFEPNFFGSQYVTGNTDLAVSVILPPGMTADEPRYYPPQNWPGSEQPQSSFTTDNRVVYTWQSTSASSSGEYIFGAGFPSKYVPATAIAKAPLISIDTRAISNVLTCGVFLAIIAGIIGLSIRSSRRRKLAYLPPKISVEGHGIKRGLTAVEAAVLMEQPVDKVLTMIMFSVIRKGAARVTSRDPLLIQVTSTLPEGLSQYERDFLKAFQTSDARARKTALQDVMIGLVKSVTENMRGFSRKETLAYYDSIMKQAWQQVEQAQTPEVKSQKFDENMDWTMLDKDYSGRTQTTFGGGPVFVPMWWGNWDPGWRGGGLSSGPSVSPASSGAPSGGKGFSMPTLPGADFAASMVNGVQSFAGGVVGDLAAFTGRVTNVTNPPPPPPPPGTTFRGGGGGGSCACACACAGCACACAGGGR